MGDGQAHKYKLSYAPNKIGKEFPPQSVQTKVFSSFKSLETRYVEHPTQVVVVVVVVLLVDVVVVVGSKADPGTNVQSNSTTVPGVNVQSGSDVVVDVVVVVTGKIVVVDVVV